MKNLLVLATMVFFAVTTYAQQYPEMINVDAGSFEMGDEQGEQGIGEANEQPVHKVTLKTFSIAKTETTVLQWKTYCNATGRSMPDAPSWGWNDKHPMVRVSFDDANGYCNWLSETTGKNYRLPTEAEWEYAARGGNKSRSYKYAGSDDLDEAGWSSDNADGQTQACGRKKANELGIYDMSGNVWEWCQDWYSDSYYSSSPSANPKGPSSGSFRVLRGASWCYSAAFCRVAHRSDGSPGSRNDFGGFRVVVPQ